MFFYVVSFSLAASFFALLWRNLHRICLIQALDNFGAKLLMDSHTDAAPPLRNVVAAIFHGSLRIHFHETLDPDLYITHKTHRLANTSHPQSPLLRDWASVADAAISSTREAIQRFKDFDDSEGGTNLYLLIQSIVLSTLLRLFFHLPVTSTNIDDIVWIVDEARRASHKEPVVNTTELWRLVKSSPNPCGVLVPQAVIQRLVLAAICTVEYKGKNIPLLQQAWSLLRHPVSPDPDVARLIRKAKKSEPPVQSIYGTLPVGTHEAQFFVPIDLLPPSACIPAADGSCASWLHKAGFASQTECGGDEWLLHVTMLILSAIQTEIRKANLIVDWDECEPEAWEDWNIRRLRVG